VRHEPKNGRGHDGLEDEIKDHVPLLGGQMFFIKAEEQGAQSGDPSECGNGDGGKEDHRGNKII